MNYPIIIATREGKLGCVCPRHGFCAGAEREQQDPAPCGCAWVWEDGYLIACPSRQTKN